MTKSNVRFLMSLSSDHNSSLLIALCNMLVWRHWDGSLSVPFVDVTKEKLVRTMKQSPPLVITAVDLEV